MLKKIAHLAAALGVLGLFLIGISWDLPLSRNCVQQTASQEKNGTAPDKPNAERCKTLRETAPIVIADARDFAYRNGHEMIEGIIAFGTLLLALFTYRLWGATGQLVRDSNISSKRELRAYLGVIGGRVVRLPKDTKALAEIDIPNRGQTPAHRVERYISAEVSEISRSQFPPPEHEPGSWPIAPGATWKLTKEIALKPGEYEELAKDDPTITIFVWGKVTYFDIFENEVLRTCAFRYRLWHKNFATVQVRLNPDGTPWMAQVHVDWGLNPTVDGNYAD